VCLNSVGRGLCEATERFRLRSGDLAEQTSTHFEDIQLRKSIGAIFYPTRGLASMPGGLISRGNPVCILPVLDLRCDKLN